MNKKFEVWIFDSNFSAFCMEYFDLLDDAFNECKRYLKYDSIKMSFIVLNDEVIYSRTR